MNAEAVSQLVTVLEKTTSPDQNDQKQASAFLEQAAQTNLPELIKVGVLWSTGLSGCVASFFFLF